MAKLTLLLTLLLFCLPLKAHETRDYWPTDAWRTSTPEEQDMDAELFDSMEQHIVDAEMTYPFALTVVRHGYVVYEGYFNDWSVNRVENLRSVTKSFTSALVGIALERGEIPGLDLTLGEVFPEYFADGANADKAAITLRDLLMMRSGFEWEDSLAKVRPFWTSRLDQTQRLLERELVHRPGETWAYSTADSQFVSMIFTRLTGQSLGDYAQEALFEPIGITSDIWVDDESETVSVGGTMLHLNISDLAKFGYLYLNNGMWGGQQIVPADWVTMTTSPQDADVPWYGYQWWRGETDLFGNHDAFVAWGSGGVYVYVYPELDLVVTALPAYPSGRNIGRQEEQVAALITDFIIPAAQ